MSGQPHDPLDVDWMDVEFTDDQLERIIAGVAAAPEQVVDLESRRLRRVPQVMSAMGAAVVIVFVLGAIGTTKIVPALDELVARHSAAAAGNLDSGAELDMTELDMDVALQMAPKVPDDLWLAQAYDDGEVMQLIYEGSDGQMVSAFMQKGEVDFGQLPDGHMNDTGEVEMWSDNMDGTEIAVVDGDNVVWTFVSASKDDAMVVATTDTLPARSLSVLEQLRSLLGWLPRL